MRKTKNQVHFEDADTSYEKKKDKIMRLALKHDLFNDNIEALIPVNKAGDFIFRNDEFTFVLDSDDNLVHENSSKDNLISNKKFGNLLLLDKDVLDDKKKSNKKFVKTEEKFEKITKLTEDNMWDVIDHLNTGDDTENFDDLTTEEVTQSNENNEEIDENMCIECGESDCLVEDGTRGVLVCSKCGMEIKELLDQNPEWRQYNDDGGKGDNLDRCGGTSNYFLPKSSLGTSISGPSFNRLKTVQRWNSMVYKERSLNVVLEEISDKCNKGGLPKIISDTAKIMYKNLSESKHLKGANKGKSIIIRGINRKSLIAACVFFSCIVNKNPRSPKEVAALFGLDVKRITKGCKHFFKLMKSCSNQHIFEQLDPDTTEHYIVRFCHKLKIKDEDIQVALMIAKNSKALKIASAHTPQSQAAGSILLMVKIRGLKHIEKKDISKTFQISDVTISKIYKKISAFGKVLINPDATNYIAKKMKITTTNSNLGTIV